MKNEILDKDERLEDLLCGGLKIVQNKNLYTFTSDSVVLANFIKLKRKEVAVEIGSGSGVISILLTKKQNMQHIYGFEVQKELYLTSQKSLKINNLEDKITFINDKIQNHKKYFSDGSVDVVFSNPPYKKEGVDVNKNVSKAIARHEIYLNLKELCLCAGKLLKFGGRFYVIYDADRLSELICELVKNKLEPKRLFFTENGKNKVCLVVIEAVKGAKPGVLVLKNITTNDENGKYIYI